MASSPPAEAVRGVKFHFTEFSRRLRWEKSAALDNAHNFGCLDDVLSMEPTFAGEATFLALKSPIQVLLVEDDPEAAQLTTSRIGVSEHGLFQLEWSDNLQSALSRLARPGIDVVLLDLGLHETSGYKTHLAIISVVGQEIPVVILTSDDNLDCRDITASQGAASYLIKHYASAVDIRCALHDAVSLESWRNTISRDPTPR